MANSKCPNCGAHLSCSCKLRTASDGKTCCTVCITTYEASIKKSEVNPVHKINVNTGFLEVTLN